MDTSDPFAGERLKLSPFYPRQKVLNIRDAWSSWNGYKFAEYYYDAEYEYFCVRNSCGTYDICPMQKYEVTGRDAETMLNRMVTRDVKKIGINRVDFQTGPRPIHADLWKPLHRLAGKECIRL
jgi:aminomethyltransferase